MKETYTRSEMLDFEVTEDELVSAENGDVKCICFPWVRIFCLFVTVGISNSFLVG